MKKILLKDRDEFFKLLLGYKELINLARKIPKEYPCYVIIAKVRHNLCIDYVFVYKDDF